MKEKIKVIVKEPGKVYEVREVANTLGQLQELVGGYIEAIRPCTDLILLVDEEGRIKQKTEQRICGVRLAGTVVLCGVDGEEFDDVPELPLEHPEIFELAKTAVWEAAFA